MIFHPYRMQHPSSDLNLGKTNNIYIYIKSASVLIFGDIQKIAALLRANRPRSNRVNGK